ncbi:MAG: cytochrome P450 [Hyphomicrobiaceae bacterium]|jgi:cytochrome P450
MRTTVEEKSLQRQTEAHRAPVKPPGPRGFLGLNALRCLEKDPLSFLRQLQSQYGDVASLRVLGMRLVVVAHPDGVRHVLQDRHAIYTKQNTDYKVLARVLGQGLVTSDGEFWRRQRRMIQPAFHKERIRGFATLMSREAMLSRERLVAAARAGQTIDIVAEAQRAALAIVVQALFGLAGADDAPRIAETFTKLNELLSASFTSVAGRFPWIPTQANRALNAEKRSMDALVDNLIAARRDAGQGGDDLLGMLLAMRDEDSGDPMPDAQLRDEITTLLVAGYETTAMALSWTIYLLGRHPEIAARVRAEATAVLADRPFSLDDLDKLETTRMVLEEAMRLYPPAWAVSRTPSQDDELDGYQIKKGAIVFISPWLTHRHPDVWPDPDRFDPDRFATENDADRPRFAYFPFLGGPRMCIGNAFASMEARILLATWLAAVELPLVTDEAIDAEPLVTLRPRGGVLVRPRL